MRRLPFVFRPGWLALALVVAAFAYLCFTVLAPWQLGKNSKTSRENNQIAASLTADPVPVTSLLSQSDSAQWRRVTAAGRYTGLSVLARLRVVDGQPAFEVLTPFVVDGGPTVLVDELHPQAFRRLFRDDLTRQLRNVRTLAHRLMNSFGCMRKFTILSRGAGMAIALRGRICDGAAIAGQRAALAPGTLRDMGFGRRRGRAVLLINGGGSARARGLLAHDLAAKHAA